MRKTLRPSHPPTPSFYLWFSCQFLKIINCIIKKQLKCIREALLAQKIMPRLLKSLVSNILALYYIDNRIYIIFQNVNWIFIVSPGLEMNAYKISYFFIHSRPAPDSCFTRPPFAGHEKNHQTTPPKINTSLCSCCQSS